MATTREAPVLDNSHAEITLAEKLCLLSEKEDGAVVARQPQDVLTS